MKRDDLKMVARAVAAGIDYGVAAHTVIKDPDALERAISGDERQSSSFWHVWRQLFLRRYYHALHFKRI